MTTIDRHLQALEELNSNDLSDLLPDLFVQRDSEDGHEDTSIPAVLGGGAGGGLNEHPLQLVASGDSLTLYVRFGTVGGEIPTISAVGLVADFTANVLSFTATGTTNYYLNCTVVENSGVQSVDSVEISTSSVSESSTATSRLLGIVTASGGTISNISNAIMGSQNVDSCGALHSWNLV